MRQIDENTLNALYGSRAGDKLIVYAWYGSDLAWPDPLPVASWGFDWDATRQVQKFSCTIADESGRLAPWLLEDPLGVGGSRLDIRYMVGGADGVNMGQYRIAKNIPEERWHTYVIDNRGQINRDMPLPNNKKLFWVSGGATIQLDAYDLALNGKNDRLVAPESPPTTPTPTIVSEVRRLMKDICPVTTADGVDDRNVNTNIIYERERMDAVQDLCKRIFCDYRMTGDGQLEIYPLAKQVPAITLQGGPEGLVVRVDRAQDLDGLRNRFVVDGSQDVNGKSVPVRAVAQIEAGALSVYGPFGRVPEFYSSTMITNVADARAYAQEMMNGQLAGLTTDLAVTCLPLPHLQQGDWVTVANPIVNGETIPLTGRVKAIKWASANGATPGPMEVLVSCSYWDVQATIGGMNRG